MYLLKCWSHFWNHIWNCISQEIDEICWRCRVYHRSASKKNWWARAWNPPTRATFGLVFIEERILYYDHILGIASPHNFALCKPATESSSIPIRKTWPSSLKSSSLPWPFHQSTRPPVESLPVDLAGIQSPDMPPAPMLPSTWVSHFPP